jgi:hypothetical protein
MKEERDDLFGSSLFVKDAVGIVLPSLLPDP